MLINLEQNSPEWLEYRKSHFNASESADTLNEGFNSPLKLAHIKYNNLEVYQNKAMSEGKRREDDIRGQVNFLCDREFKPIVVQSDEDNRFSASLDGYDETHCQILEIKNSHNEFLYLKEHKEPSRKYYIQIQHQLMVCKNIAKSCIYAVRDPESEEITIEVFLPHYETWEQIKQAWDKFEATYKDKELAPLENIIDESSDEAGEYKSLIDELKEKEAQKKELDARIGEIKASLISKADGVKTKAFGVSIFSTTRNTIDYKAFLKSRKLEVPSEFSKTSISWTVRVG